MISFTLAIHSSGNSGAVPEGGEQGIRTEKYHTGCRLGSFRGRQRQAENQYLIITRRVWVPCAVGSGGCLPLGRDLSGPLPLLGGGWRWRWGLGGILRGARPSYRKDVAYWDWASTQGPSVLGVVTLSKPYSEQHDPLAQALFIGTVIHFAQALFIGIVIHFAQALFIGIVILFAHALFMIIISHLA